jgi:hypothetical protein
MGFLNYFGFKSQPTPQEEVNQAAERLHENDTTLKVTGGLRAAASLLLPAPLKAAKAGLTLWTAYQGAQRYHESALYEETLKEAKKASPSVKDTYQEGGGFFQVPTEKQLTTATQDLHTEFESGLKTGAGMLEQGAEIFEQLKKTFGK